MTVTRKNSLISLRLVFIVPFLLQIFAAVALVGYLSFKNGEKAVNRLATRLGTEISSRVREHIDNYLKASYAIAGSNIDAIYLERLDTKNTDDLAIYFLKQVQRFQSVRAIYFAGDYKNGEFALGKRNLDGTLQVKVYEGFPNRITYLVNAEGDFSRFTASGSERERVDGGSHLGDRCRLQRFSGETDGYRKAVDSLAKVSRFTMDLRKRRNRTPGGKTRDRLSEFGRVANPLPCSQNRRYYGSGRRSNATGRNRTQISAV